MLEKHPACTPWRRRRRQCRRQDQSQRLADEAPSMARLCFHHCRRPVFHPCVPRRRSVQAGRAALGGTSAPRFPTTQGEASTLAAYAVDHTQRGQSRRHCARARQPCTPRAVTTLHVHSAPQRGRSGDAAQRASSAQRSSASMHSFAATSRPSSAPIDQLGSQSLVNCGAPDVWWFSHAPTRGTARARGAGRGGAHVDRTVVWAGARRDQRRSTCGAGDGGRRAVGRGWRVVVDGE